MGFCRISHKFTIPSFPPLTRMLSLSLRHKVLSLFSVIMEECFLSVCSSMRRIFSFYCPIAIRLVSFEKQVGFD